MNKILVLAKNRREFVEWAKNHTLLPQYFVWIDDYERSRGYDSYKTMVIILDGFNDPILLEKMTERFQIEKPKLAF